MWGITVAMDVRQAMHSGPYAGVSRGFGRTPLSAGYSIACLGRRLNSRVTESAPHVRLSKFSV